MKIVLMAPPLMDFAHGVLTPISMDAVRTCPPYGIYLLAAVLAQQGHEVVVLDLIALGTIDLRPYQHLFRSCSLVGISVSSLSWPSGKACIAGIRQMCPDLPIVLGGIHPTMFDAYVLATTEATFVIRGEAEVALPRLCEVLARGGELRTVPSLTYKPIHGGIRRTPVAPRMTAQEIAEAPVPDYAKIPAGVYTGLGLESSRGCPFDCIFCSTSYRKSWRCVPAERFVDKVAQILPFLGRTVGGLVQIIDDEFSLDSDRAIGICSELQRRQMPVRLVFDARANDLLKEDFLAAIAPFAHQFLVGAECGYEEGLKRVGKGTTVENLRRAAAQLRRHGLAERADFSFIIGLPWETKAEVMETVRFASGLYSEFGIRALLQWYCQIPGSRLWDEQRRSEVLHEAHYDDFGFFRNHYLFRTGTRLRPSEVHEVHEIIQSLQGLASRNINGMDMIQASVPEPILQFYPKVPEAAEASGLANLREVAGVC